MAVPLEIKSPTTVVLDFVIFQAEDLKAIEYTCADSSACDKSKLACPVTYLDQESEDLPIAIICRCLLFSLRFSSPGLEASA